MTLVDKANNKYQVNFLRILRSRWKDNIAISWSFFFPLSKSLASIGARCNTNWKLIAKVNGKHFYVQTLLFFSILSVNIPKRTTERYSCSKKMQTSFANHLCWSFFYLIRQTVYPSSIKRVWCMALLSSKAFVAVTVVKYRC